MERCFDCGVEAWKNEIVMLKLCGHVLCFHCMIICQTDRGRNQLSCSCGQDVSHYEWLLPCSVSEQNTRAQK
jgi:hypothetical protein